MNVVVVGAGLSGLSAACHLAGRGHDVTVVERDAMPGWPRRLSRARRLPVRHRADRPDDAVVARADASPPPGPTMADMLTLHPVDPMYRASFADGSVIHVRHGREAMTEEIRDVVRRREAAAFDRFCDWLTALYDVEMPHFIDRNFDSPLDLARPVRPGAASVAPRRLRGGWRRRWTASSTTTGCGGIFSFQAMYAGLAPYEALAALRRHHLHGLRGRCLLPRGRHARRAVGAGRGRHQGRRRVPLRDDGRADPARRTASPGRSGGAPGRRRAAAGDAVVCNPDLPVAYRTLLPGLPAPRRAAAAASRPRASCGTSASAATLPAGTAHHNIHFGGEWDGPSGRSRRRACACPTRRSW